MGNCATSQRVEFPNGDVYEGEWHDGQMHGHGTLITAAGHIYEGKFKAGHKQGFGVQTSTEPKETYTGEWMANHYHGNGVLELSGGRIYRGVFRHGLPDGPCTLSFPKGDMYRGRFLAGHAHGHGTYVAADGSATMEVVADQGTFTDPKSGELHMVSQHDLEHVLLNGETKKRIKVKRRTHDWGTSSGDDSAAVGGSPRKIKKKRVRKNVIRRGECTSPMRSPSPPHGLPPPGMLRCYPLYSDPTTTAAEEAEVALPSASSSSSAEAAGLRQKIQQLEHENDRLLLLAGQRAATASSVNNSVWVQRPSASACVICLDKSAEYLLVPCGHQCLCKACVELLATSSSSSSATKCPICKMAFTQVVKVYAS